MNCCNLIKKRIKLISILLVLLFNFLIILDSYAQNGELLVNVHIKIIEFGITNTDKRVDPVFKFFLSNESGNLLNKNGGCYKFFSKEPDNSFILPDPKYPLLDKELETFTVPILSRSSFTLVMECYINNKGEVCTFDKKDNFHSITNKVIDLNSLTPGDFSDTMRIADNQNHFYCIIQLKYSLLKPPPIKASTPLDSINSANKTVELNSIFPIPNKDKLSFIWEYSIDKGTYWNRLNTNKENLPIKIDPLNNLFGGRLTTTEKTMFRLRVNSRDTFAISDTLVTFFTAPPPAFSAENQQLLKTCAGYESGSIIINNIHSVSDKILYVLTKRNSGGGCILQNPSFSNCPGFIKSGETTTSTIELKNLAVNDYSLLLYNPNLQIGNVATPVNFTINSFAPLKIQNTLIKNPSCTNNNAGEISVTIEGGSNTNTWEIALTPNKGVLERKENQITFKNLDEGDYTLEINDGCGSHVSNSFSLKKPQKLIIENIKIQTTPELALIFSLKNGTGLYKLVVSDAKQYGKTLDSFTNMILQLPGPGIYHIQIFDKSDPECVSADTNITVGGAKNAIPLKNKPKQGALDFLRRDFNFKMLISYFLSPVSDKRRKFAHPFFNAAA